MSRLAAAPGGIRGRAAGVAAILLGLTLSGAPTAATATARPASAATGAVLEGGIFAPNWAPQGGGPSPDMYSVSLVLSGGHVWLEGTCLTYGRAAYTAASDGSWSFDRGTLSARGCPGFVAADTELVLGAMAQATAWTVGETYPQWAPLRLTGPQGVLSATIYPPDGQPAFAEPPSAPQPIGALTGEWRIEQIDGTAHDFKGPSAWTMTLTEDTVHLPAGCNIGSGAGYVATPTGDWLYAAWRGARTLKGCHPANSPSNQSEAFQSVLGSVRQWELAGPENLLLRSADGAVRVALARPGAANRAVQVSQLRTSVKTLRLAKGSAVTLRVLADPVADGAAGQARVSWKVSKTSVARVNGSRSKSGALSVRFGAPAGAKLTVKGVKVGTSAIVLKAPSGKSVKVRVVVVKAPVKATGLKLSIPGARMADGAAHLPLFASTRAVAKLRPAGATSGALKWSSSDKSVVQVDSAGQVRTVGAGTAVVKVKVRGLTAKLTVKVGL
jgi:hypothetical protein